MGRKPTEKTPEEQRQAMADYMKAYRERVPRKQYYSPEKQKEAKAKFEALPTMTCGCGGTYKNAPARFNIHARTTKHILWQATEMLIPRMVEADEAKTEAGARRQIESRFKTHAKNTNKSKCDYIAWYSANVNNMIKAKQQADAEAELAFNIMSEGTKKAEAEAEAKEAFNIMVEDLKKKEAEAEAEEPPVNEIIKANTPPPPPPPPPNDGADIEKTSTEDGDIVSEGEEEQPPPPPPKKAGVNWTRSKEDLENDKANAIRRAKAFYNKLHSVSPPPSPPASPPPRPPSPPPQKVNMNDYFNDEPDDPWGDKYIARFTKKGRGEATEYVFV